MTARRTCAVGEKIWLHKDGDFLCRDKGGEKPLGGGILGVEKRKGKGYECLSIVEGGGVIKR